MKRRILAWVMAAVMCLIISVPAVATPLDLMLATGSDAVYATDSNSGVMTLDLPNDEYGVSAISSIKDLESTINWANTSIYAICYRPSTNLTFHRLIASGTNVFTWDPTSLYSDLQVSALYVRLFKGALPPTGKYQLQFDYTSDNGVDWNGVYFYATKDVDNALRKTLDLRDQISNLQTSSGDAYWSTNIDIQSVSFLSFGLRCAGSSRIKGKFGGTFNVAFTPLGSSASTDVVAAPVEGATDDTTAEYQASTTSFLGNIVDFFSDLLTKQDSILGNITNFASSVTNSFASLGSSITNKLSDVLSGIQSGLDDVTDGITSKLSSVSSAITSKLTAVTDKITGGYDNSGITSDNDQLDKTLDDYASDEDLVMDQISEPINTFEFDNPVSQYLSTFLLFGNFLQDIFTGSGAMADVINLSFLMGIALMVAGLYRFKGGN